MRDEEPKDLRRWLDGLPDLARWSLDPQALYREMGLDPSDAEPVNWDEVARCRQAEETLSQWQRERTRRSPNDTLVESSEEADRRWLDLMERDDRALSVCIPLLRRWMEAGGEGTLPRQEEAFLAAVAAILRRRAARLLNALPMPDHHREEARGDLQSEVIVAVRESGRRPRPDRTNMLSFDEDGRPFFVLPAPPDPAMLTREAASRAKVAQRRLRRRQSKETSRATLDAAVEGTRAEESRVIERLDHRSLLRRAYRADPDLVELLVKGLTQIEMAARLRIHERTLRKRLQRLREALEAVRS